MTPRNYIVLVIFVGLLSFVVGASMSTATPTEAAPIAAAPVTTTIEVTPQSCIEALDLAQEGFELAAAGITAAVDNDKKAVKKVTAQVNALVEPLTTASRACRAAQ